MFEADPPVAPTPLAPPELKRPGGTWKAVNRMPQGIALGVDEQVVKQYRIGRYTLRQGSIDVVVTNKRVIRYEESSWFGMRTNRIDEINIDAVHGTSCTMARSISAIGLVSSLALLMLGVLTLTMSGNGYRYYSVFNSGVFGWLLILGAVVIIVNSLRPTLRFCLHGAVGGPALETEVNVAGRIFGRNYASLVFQFKPTPETTEMLKEIGAVIYDLKTLGDKAMEKWQ